MRAGRRSSPCLFDNETPPCGDSRLDSRVTGGKIECVNVLRARTVAAAGCALAAAVSLPTAAGQAVPVHTAVGVEYAQPGMAATLAGTRAPAVKYFPDAYAWGKMQPSPGAAIDFAVTDGYVREYQAAGFSELVMALNPQCSWGSRGGNDLSPKPQYLDAYGQWVAALVERYDGDGAADMPGLMRAVRTYEIGTEFSTYEPEPVANYLEMLERAHQTAHAAYAEVRIAHCAFLTTTAFRNDPTPGQYEAAFAAVDPRIMYHSLQDMRAVLDHPELFELVNAHSIGDPDEIAAIVAWLRWEMAQRGYERPIVISDTSTTPFIAWGPATTCVGLPAQLGLIVPPAVAADRCRLAAYFTTLVAGEAAVVEWTQAFAAADLVEKVVVATEQGIELIDTWSTEDIWFLKLPLFGAGAGTAAWAGMAEWTANPVTEQRTFVSRRPALTALEQVVRHLGAAETILRVPHADPRVRLFQLDGQGGRGWVGWLAAVPVVLPGDPVPVVEVTVEASAAPVVAERVAGGGGPGCSYLSLAPGPVAVPLTLAPVFVTAGADERCAPRPHRRLGRAAGAP
jgi:hypothetical protein